MSRMMRVYYNGILGALGGAIGWQLSNLMGLSFTPNIYLSEVLIGALIGFCIGFSIGLGEGILTRQIIQTARASLIGGFLGVAGGAIGLPIAEGVFQLLGGGILSRIVGWGVFGVVIGVASGITGGSQVWKAALGGMLGGLLGSALLEAFRGGLKNPLLGKAAGLLLLGASIGVFIVLITYLLSRAWLEVKSGKMKGTEFILDKFMKKDGPSAILGSNALKADIVLPDPDIDPQHALLKGADTHFTLKDLSLKGTYVDNKRIEQVVLRNNQIIKIGNTDIIYHEKR